VLAVGVYDAYKEEVEPGFLSILDPAPAKIVAPVNLNSSGRRTALAEWLALPENPLSARVMVNRIWHYHFGRGHRLDASDLESWASALRIRSCSITWRQRLSRTAGA